MTLGQTLKTRPLAVLVAAAVLGSATTGVVDRTVLAPASQNVCHIAPGDSCLVVADLPIPSAAPSATPTPTAVQSLAPTTAPTPAPTPITRPSSAPTVSPLAASGCYGPCIGFDTLANTQVLASQPNYYRFRASQSSAIKSLRVYIIANGNTGYSHGTGGSMVVKLETCSGLFPSGTVLATSTAIATGNPSSASMFTYIFPTPAVAVAGTLYCAVWVQASTTDYVSLDGTYTWNRQTPRQPVFPDGDFGWGYGTGSGWVERTQDPILDVAYASGAHGGSGYMEVSYGSDQGTVSGSREIREQFTVSGGDRTISSANVFVWRASGSAPLTLALAGGAQTFTGSIAATTFPLLSTQPPANGADQTWGGLVIPTIVLVSGQTYSLTLSTASGTTYGTMPIRKGSIDYGFSPSTVFTDGNAQQSADGVTWSSLGRVANENDLPFWLGQ